MTREAAITVVLLFAPGAVVLVVAMLRGYSVRVELTRERRREP